MILEASKYMLIVLNIEYSKKFINIKTTTKKINQEYFKIEQCFF
jgi:hypothetical protein